MDGTRGVATPFRRDGKSDFASATGADLLRSKVELVLSTEPGELPWRTAFGAGLSPLRHRAWGPALEGLCAVKVRDALRRWLPSVETVSVAAAHDPSGTLVLRVRVRDGSAEAVAEVPA